MLGTTRQVPISRDKVQEKIHAKVENTGIAQSPSVLRSDKRPRTEARLKALHRRFGYSESATASGRLS